MENYCLGCMEPLPKGEQICPLCGYDQAEKAKEVYHLEPGTILRGRYLIGRSVGYGGFGVTYIARDLVLERTVAVKEYLPSEFATREPGQQTLSVYSGEAAEQFTAGLKSFSDEAKRLAKLSHIPGVVEIIDTFAENRTSYIVMEYLKGETVKELLDREGKLPYDETERIIASVLATLSAVHPLGIIHRDVSPSNIFLTENGKVVNLIDFGAARYASAVHTKSLSVILKPGYAPEEQYRSRGNQGPWTDVYATAATMYRMLTGKVPQESIERMENDKLKEPSKLGVKIDPNKENALMNALNVEAGQRTQTAQQFLDELTGGGKVESNFIRLKRRDEGRWPTWLKIAVGAVPVLIAAVALILVNSGGTIHSDDFTNVPNLISLSENDARVMLEEAELYMAVAGTVPVDFGDSGLVQSSDPESGAFTRKYETISVMLSVNETVFMPDVLYWQEEEAQARMETAGLNVHIEYEETSEYADGVVIRQQVSEGEGLARNTLVTICVAINIPGEDDGQTVEVPNLAGMTLQQAQAELQSRGLYLKVTSEQYSDNYAAGIVISNSRVGEQVNKFTYIDVTQSMGRKSVRMPDLYLKTADEASALLGELGIKYSFVYQATNDYNENLVLNQSESAGTKLYEENEVIITLSEYEYGDVPDVTNKTEAEAVSLIEQAGFVARVSSETMYSQTIKAGRIVQQSAVGKYQMGKVITIYVSAGPSTVYKNVPNVAGLTAAEAEYRLLTANFEYRRGADAYSSTVPAGCVISYSPTGSQVLGTAVTVVVSLGQEHRDVPNVAGMEAGSAQQTLQAAGFRYRNGGEAYDNSVPSGCVISYSPAGSQRLGSTVTCVISKGPEWLEVPNVVGQTQSNALAALRAIDMNVSVSTAHSETVPYGSVISQTVGAGSQVLRGDYIEITVSCGTSGRNISVNELQNYPESQYIITQVMEYRYYTRTREETQKEAHSLSAPSLDGWTALGEVSRRWVTGSWVKGSNPSYNSSLQQVENKTESERTGTNHHIVSYIINTVARRSYYDTQVSGSREVEDYRTTTCVSQNAQYAVAPGQYSPDNSGSFYNAGTRTAYQPRAGRALYFCVEENPIYSNVNYYRINDLMVTYSYERYVESGWSGWTTNQNQIPSGSDTVEVTSESRLGGYYVVGRQ